MKQVLQLEELGQLLIGIAGLYLVPFNLSWWLWIILFFSPDIFMLGYLMNTRMGALIYNLGHHKGIAIAIAAVGFYFKNDYLLFAGLLLFSHSTFDRALGFGLKYSDSFQHTHLDNFSSKKMIG